MSEHGPNEPTAGTLLGEFAVRTGLASSSEAPRRYLWTDAFAVCTCIELYRRTTEPEWRDLALGLVDQVHQVLGRYRHDDPARTGWISGLDEEQGHRHPTAGGLRIGKERPERGPREPLDERAEWDRDGQYYHYLTKWTHALCRVYHLTEDPAHLRWARELARVAHDRFTYVPSFAAVKRMHWKMSIDLSRPLVPAMGQHDPLDGWITDLELQSAPASGGDDGPDLKTEIAELSRMARSGTWTTDDPLGIGGLLFDAGRAVQLAARGSLEGSSVPAAILDAALSGLAAWTAGDPFSLPPAYRLGFRELGLSIGLHALPVMQACVDSHREQFGAELDDRLQALREYAPWAQRIEAHWSQENNRSTPSWTAHRDINEVMLATSLYPDEFLAA